MENSTEIHLRNCSLTATANGHRYHFFDLCATLNAFSHNRRTILAGHHVTARFEENAGPFVRTHQTLVDFLAGRNTFATNETLFDTRCASITTANMTAWLK